MSTTSAHMATQERGRQGSRPGQGCRLWLAALAMVLGAITTGHAAGGDILRQTGDSQAGKQEAKAMTVDSQGNTIVTGYQNLSGGANDDYLTVKFKADGSGVAWRATYDRAGGSDQATAVAVDANNDVIVSGFAWNGVNQVIHTLKYSGSDGSLLWQQTYTSAAGGNAHATALAVDPLGSIYVGGSCQGAGGNDDYLVLKYGPAGGSPLWQASYNGPANGNDQLLALSSGSNGLAVTGQSWNGTSFDQLTISYDFNGTQRWVKSHAGNGGAVGKKIRLDGGGNIIVTGSAIGTSIKEIYTVKYAAANGNVVWEKSYNNGYENDANGLAVDAGGDVYITGYSWTLAGNENYYTARYAAADGALVWQQSFDSGSGNTDVAAPLVLDEAGDLFVTGYTVAGETYRFQTIKYKRDNGNQLWQQAFSGPANGNSRPVGIGLSPGGDVLVAGWTDTGTNGLDYYLVTYDNGALNQPGSLTATTLSTSSIRLDWADNSANEEGFKVERKLGELGSYAQVATVGANVTSYTDTELAANNYYYYRVRAYSAANGDSHYSNEAHALTVYLNQLPPAWTFSYANPDNLDDYANAIAIGPDNHPVVTGFSQRSVGGFDYYTLKLNRADKSTLWSDLYDDPDSEMDKATCVAVDSANNAVVSGFASLFFPPAQKNINSIYTLSYPSAGPPAAWAAQYNGPGGVDDRAVAVATATAVDSGNNSVVIGHGKNLANNDDIYVLKYNPGGSLAWSATPFDGNGGNDYPNAVAVAPDSSVYVAGYSETTAGSGIYKLFVAKYNGASGAQVWADVYTPQAGGTNRVNSAAVDGNGDLYVTGYATNAAGNRDLYTIKYSGTSPTPLRLWERAVDGAAHGDDEGIGVRVDPIDGDVVVSGTTLTAAGDQDITLLRYTPAGDQEWQRTLQRPGNDDHAVSLAMDSSGYLYIAATTSNGGTSDIISLIYDFEGTSLAATLFNGAANSFDEASGIAVNHLGEAFVAGYSVNANGDADYVVVKQTNPYILVPAPLSVTPQADYARINLAWGNNTPGTAFLIERTLGPVWPGSVWTPVTTATAGSSSFQDSGLNPDSSYCYRIAAYSGSLFSRWIVACATTTLPPPVMNPLAILSATAIDISWTNVAGNSGYRLERQAGSGSWSQVGGILGADTTVYHDTGLTAGTVYSYRVSAISAAGSSLPSTVLVAPVLNPPSGITSGKIDLTWPAVPGASGYRVERSLDNSAWSLIASPGATTGYSDTSVASGTLYYYRLRGVTPAGESVPSLVQSASSKLKTPAITSAGGSSTNQITLTWSDPNNNESGYTVEYSYCYSLDYPAGCIANINSDWAWGGWQQSSFPANSTTAVIGSLVPGQTYRLRVTANLAGANSDASAMTTATVNLAAPNLTATAATATTATLSWNDILGEDNYRVIKDGVVLTGSGLPLARNATAYTATGLSQNVPYCFTIQPYNAYGFADSNQACVTLYGPPTLTGISVTGQTQLSLSWNDVPGASGYEVWRSAATYQSSPPASPASGSWSGYTNITPTPLTAGTTSYVVSSGLTAGYTYKFQIRYKLADGSFSPFSNELMETTIPPTPASPYIGSATASQINFNWYDGYGETGYAVQIKQLSVASCASEDWSGITPVPLAQNSTTYPATGLTSGATYCLRLQAVNGNGPSPWTAPLTATSLLPAPVLNAPIDISQSQLSLSWSSVSGNYGYRIERSTDNISWSQLALVLTDVVTYTNTNLLPNQIYYYRVSTKNSAGAFSSPASNVQSATTLAVTAPLLAPLSGITTSQIIVSWNDVSGNNGYKVERSGDNVSWEQIATPAPGATSYTNTGLTAGTLYYYRVATKNSSGNYSAPSNTLSAVTTPAAPVITLAVVSEAAIDLSWPVVQGATNYKLLRSVGPGGPYGQVTNRAVPYTTLYCGTDTTASIGCPTLVAALTTYTDSGLGANSDYCYQLLAWNASGGDSAASNTLCGKTPAVNGPSLTAVTALGAMKVRLDWTYNPAACTPLPCTTPDGFQVWRQAWNGEWVPIDTVGNVTTYLDTTNIEPLKRYGYRVRAYKGGDLSTFSNTMAAETPAFSGESSTCP